MSENNTLTLPCEAGEVSDGYHTFNQLYEHRHVLFLHLVLANKADAFKTWRDKGGETWEGWFILGLNTEYGQVTYHMPERYWNRAEVAAVEQNTDYDGHDSVDVLHRLELFLNDKIEMDIPF